MMRENALIAALILFTAISAGSATLWLQTIGWLP